MDLFHKEQALRELQKLLRLADPQQVQLCRDADAGIPTETLVFLCTSTVMQVIVVLVLLLFFGVCRARGQGFWRILR
jgi:hypothetical protein